MTLAATVPPAPATAAAGYAFVLGLVGVANPCGLPLLPAYLSFFVGGSGSAPRRAVRGVVASSCVTAGFVTCFGIIGLALGGVVAEVESVVPWLMIVAGAAMVVVGVASLTGRYLPLVQLRRGLTVRNRTPLTMAAFGVFYALASLGCSLPVFVAAVGGSLDRSGAWVVFRSCVAYALGMGVLLAVIAMVGAATGPGAARGETRLARLIRASGRFGQPAAGGLLAVSGAYLTYYWAVSLNDSLSTPWLIATVNHMQSIVANWLTANGRWLGLCCGALAAAVLVWAALNDRTSSDTNQRVIGPPPREQV